MSSRFNTDEILYQISTVKPQIFEMEGSPISGSKIRGFE